MTKKVLTLAEFRELPGEHQFDVLHKYAVYVGKSKINNRKVVLFQLHGFYVEVHYRQYRKTIHHLIISESTDILQPYLDQIQIRDFDGTTFGNTE